MLITRIELENIKSYRQISIDFRRGTTAISGANGAGKTTLVEAIGFALFNFLPYSQTQFVREGEKYGKVTVHLLGGDDRPYVVDRRCGSGAYWRIYDQEADLRLEQRTDVDDKLHEIFGIDRERKLESLFSDALGVPQGTFTSVFLEAASKRKQTFDALLQIEDYKTAADNLLDTQKIYKEQLQEQKGEIQRLTILTSELPTWRQQLQEAYQTDAQQKEQHITWSREQTRYEQLLQTLNTQLNHLLVLEQRFNASQQDHNHALNLLHEREQQLQTARTAQAQLQINQPHYERYQQTQETLTRLRQQAQQRDTLRQRYARHDNTRTKLQSTIQNIQDRLNEIEIARQEIQILSPQVQQQTELEEQRDQARQRLTRYEQILAEIQRLRNQQTRQQQEQSKLQQRITTIEPLSPLAERLQERNDTLTRLRIQASERKNKTQQLQEKQTTLRQKQQEQQQLDKKLRNAESNVNIIEEHRQEAEEMPTLQEQYARLDAQKNRLEGNIEGYVRSRAQSAGGQCPLLNESCLNIRERGIVSLESYFDNLLTTEHQQVDEVVAQQQTIQERMGQIKRYAEALSKIEQYIERRDTLVEQQQYMLREIQHLENDCASLISELQLSEHVSEQLSEAEQAYTASKEADTKVRELAGLYKQVHQLQEQIHQYELELQNRQQEASTLQNSQAELHQILTLLGTLNDPRSRMQAYQTTVAREETYRQQLLNEQQTLQELGNTIQELENQLAQHTGLDDLITEQEALQKESAPGYQLYLKHIQEAQQLPAREQAHQQQVNATAKARQRLQEIGVAYESARNAFNEQELTHVQQTLEQTRGNLIKLAQEMKHHQDYMNNLQFQIDAGERYMAELETAQQEYQTIEDLLAMIDQFRKLIKEAAPHVLRAMLSDISLEANRIFGEIMGDRSAQLSWKNDYEIILRRQGVDRTFAQLSGGEQMSAALAVRLALLKKLSTLNIAFFDEPTQNMDELRRMNLAEQIRRVRGFDQLIVISHDDTFEQGLDSLVRLNKIHGETQLVVDKDDDPTELPTSGIVIHHRPSNPSSVQLLD